MSNVYSPCICGSGKKFKFCCHGVMKSGGVIPANTDCCKFPIYECRVLEKWRQSGISPVYVTRELSAGSYVSISYLVDFWCLGVKDIVVKLGITKADLSSIYNRSQELATVSYQDARSLILGAADFAKEIDINPHPSWNGMPSSFIEAHVPYVKKFSFGQEGKHYYFAGPYDSQLYHVEEIISKVAKVNGYYMAEIGSLN